MAMGVNVTRDFRLVCVTFSTRRNSDVPHDVHEDGLLIEVLMTGCMHACGTVQNSAAGLLTLNSAKTKSRALRR